MTELAEQSPVAVPIAQLRRFSHSEGDHRRMPLSGIDLAEDFHEASKMRASMPAAMLGPAGDFFVAVEDAPFLVGRPGLSHSGPEVSLPRPSTMRIDLAEVIRQRRSWLPDRAQPITMVELGTILGLSAACRDDAGRFRHHPSAGALFPLDVVVLISPTCELPAAGYLYDPITHALRPRRSIDVVGLRSSLAATGMTGASITIALVATFARSRAKYGLRGYRFALMEAGHLAQAIITVATAMHLYSLPWGGFIDDEVDRALDLDGVDRSCLYVLGLSGQEPGDG
jgi:SagB-type dehydrogenase family enzyme